MFALSKTTEGECILMNALHTTGQLVVSFVVETLLEKAKRVHLAPSMSEAPGGVDERSYKS